MKNYTQMWLAVGDGQPVCNQLDVLSLSDVLQEVPLLLGVMPSESLAALLAVSQTHRRQVNHCVRHILLSDQRHIQTLVSGSWSSLATWQLRGSTIPSVGMMLWTSACAAQAAHSGQGKYTQSATCGQGKYTQSATCGAEQRVHLQGCLLQPCRPFVLSAGHLEQLDLSHNQLDAAAIAHLTAASWPCLKELNLSCTGLSPTTVQQLCLLSSSSGSSNSSNSSSGGSSSSNSNIRCWPALTHFNFSGNSMCPSTSCTPAQPVTGLAADATGWTWRLKWLDLSHNRIKQYYTTIQQLTKMHWPFLKVLYLRHTHTDINAMTHLICRRRPMLSVLDIRGVAVGAPALQALLKAPWRQHLRFLLTINMQDPAVFKQLVAICWDQQWVTHLHSLELEKSCLPPEARSICQPPYSCLYWSRKLKQVDTHICM